MSMHKNAGPRWHFEQRGGGVDCASTYFVISAVDLSWLSRFRFGTTLTQRPPKVSPSRQTTFTTRGRSCGRRDSTNHPLAVPPLVPMAHHSWPFSITQRTGFDRRMIIELLLAGAATASVQVGIHHLR